MDVITNIKIKSEQCVIKTREPDEIVITGSLPSQYLI